MLSGGHLGIHPPGALGVAFFMHAKADCFVGRCDDGITQLLKDTGSLRVLEEGSLRVVSLHGQIFANMLEADALDRLPELLFVCCNPDQLGLFTAEMTRYLENLADRGRLTSIGDVRKHVPILLVLPNGILSEQMLATYDEQLNESLLMRRLPGVTSPMIDALLERVVRGVSLQAGGRKGGGADAKYVLERKGSVVFAGGGDTERERVESILDVHGYPYSHARGVPGTRIEFDKAMISMVLNVGGLIHMVDPDGELADLRMGDLCSDPSKTNFVERITRAVFDVGQAVGAYPSDADYDQIWNKHRDTILAHAGHVTSSVKSFRDAVDRGLSGVKLFSNEEWLLTPLGRYAAKAGLVAEEALFRMLRREVQEAMARAIQHRDQAAGQNGSRGRKMKLIAQRNFGLELHDAGSDEIVVVGTMLDDEHLIKLEVTIYLPDEQITRSRLDMIRVPFPVCHEVESIADRLVGLRIERGVLSEISKRVGGRVGCSHIKELAANIMYFAASHLVRRRTGVDLIGTDYTHKLPEERFTLTKELLRDSCLAYCQTTAQGLDERIGIKRVGEDHMHSLPLGEYEPSLGVLLEDRARKLTNKVYMRYRDGDEVRSLTWNEFVSQTFAIARQLLARGVRPGDRLAVISENRPEMFMFELATMSIGAVTIPIFAGYHPPQIAYVLNHARPRFLVVSGSHQLKKIDRSQLPWIRECFCMDAGQEAEGVGGGGGSDVTPFADLTSPDGASQEELAEAIRSVKPDDLCMIMYTSGTTGSPKGVKLCHHNLISQQKAISLIWDIDEHDVFLSYLPWHHSFGGLFERYMTLYSGCELCLDDSRGRDMDRMVDNWRAFDPTVFFSVPRVHDLLVTASRENKEIARIVFDGRLRLVFTAGAALPAHIEAAYRKRSIPVLEGWGLTETSPCVTVTAKESAWRNGYVGFPIPGVTVRIDSNQEILVKGPNVMEGYLNDEEATAQVLDAEGWFRTGDLGEFTKYGLRLFGRKDGAFKLTTGEKVHPQRVESVLVNESPYIATALVHGSGKDFVAALVYLDQPRVTEWARKQGLPTDNLHENPEVRALLCEEIARANAAIEIKYHRIKRFIIADHEPSLADGELTPSGKIVRKVIFDKHRDRLDRLFAPSPSGDVVEIEEDATRSMCTHEA